MTDLRRHVPPLTLTWDEECPGALWRVVDGTLVFADVSGFTALTEKLSRRGRIGAEEIVETLNRVFGPMLRIAAARGGELLKFGGDALLFLFRGEDHPEQACDAAVEMRSALRAAAAVPTSVGRLSLSMSVGLHSGDIHLFLVGEPTRELLILGPGATATADAEKAADAGQIVVSPATAYRIGSHATRDRGDGQLLLRRRVAHTDPPGATPLPPADPTLLRTLFPHALGDYLAPAIPDPEHRLSCIAFIRFSGTDALLAGPGPDVLAESLHRTVSLAEEALEPEGVSLLATDLDSDGGKFFLGSGIPTAFEDNEGRMLRALRRIADAHSPLPLQLGTNRGHVFAAEVGIPERGAYTGMGDTTNTAARIMAKAPPGRVVIAVEEAHWADAASAALLVRIAAAVVDRPWAVIAIRRSEDGGFDPEGGIRIDLDPLPDTVIERLVIAATEATPLRPQEIAAVVRRAEGNPLFVDEVTRVAVGAGSLDGLPESVGAALLTQIDALLPHHRRILRYCAVLGRSFRTEILRLVLEADGIDLTARDLGDLSAFLETDGEVRMRFRNSMVRDAAYEGLAYRIRARLHRTAAETLERISTDLDADAPTLALHFWRAGDVERTWTYARRAGAEARRAYANVDAAELYERAIEVSRRVDGVTDADRAELYALLGELRELAGVLDGSIEAYRRAAALTPDPVGRALVLAKRARVHQRAGAPRTALRVVTQARRLLDGADGAEAAAVMVRLDNLIALIRLGQEKAREAQLWATRAAEGARRIDDLDNLGSALLASGHALWQLGLPGPGDRIQEALEIYEQCADLHGQAVARTNLGVLAFGAGRWSEALEWYRSSRDVALRAGMDFQAAEADLNIAEILIHQGDLDEAEEVLRGAVRVLRASGMPLVALFGDLLLARLVLRRGDLEDADRAAAQVVEQSTDLGSPLNAAEALLVRAQVALEQGDALAALELVEAADVAAGEEVVAVAAQAQLVRGGALLRLGRREDALVSIDAGLESARAQELLYEEARLLEVRAAIVDGTPDEARAHELLAEMGVRV